MKRKYFWDRIFYSRVSFTFMLPVRPDVGRGDHYKYSLSMCSCWRIHLMSVNFTFLWNQQSRRNSQVRSRIVNLTTNGNINHWKQISSQFFFNPHFPVESLVPTYVSISLLWASHQFPWDIRAPLSALYVNKYQMTPSLSESHKKI